MQVVKVNAPRTPGFAVLPHALMRQVQDAAVWAVFAAVYSHASKEQQGCSASVATVMKETGAGRRTVQHALAWLRENGWLVAEERPGYATVYHLGGRLV
jgi:DNA-binding transcriptional regulator PaaX